jgi:ABC-type transport system involved in multi-copper enzyme maturation permease subunit
MRLLRDIALVAGFDLMESLRSWRALLLLLLFLAGSVFATLIFVEVLNEIEQVAANALRVPATSRPGALTASLRQSDELIHALTNLVGEEQLVRQILGMPVLAIFYGWVALTFTPALSTFVAGGSVASERASGSARFALGRTGRTAWAVGKLCGQALVLLVGLQIAALGVWVVGMIRTTGMPPVETAVWLARMGLRGWVYGLPWLGLSLGLSQLTRSVYVAWGLCIGGLIVGGALRGALNLPVVVELAPAFIEAARTLLPGTHELDLWRPALVDRAPAMGLLAAMGVVGFTLGHLRFLRADA